MNHALKVTVTNDSDPTCQRIVLIEHHEIVADGNSSNDITDIIKGVERRFNEIFPRNMSYTRPFTTVEVTKIRDTDAERLLRQAYASGQLRDTIIGDKLRDYFGVSYTEISAEPYEETAA